MSDWYTGLNLIKIFITKHYQLIKHIYWTWHQVLGYKHDQKDITVALGEFTVQGKGKDTNTTDWVEEGVALQRLGCQSRAWLEMSDWLLLVAEKRTASLRCVYFNKEDLKILKFQFWKDALQIYLSSILTARETEAQSKRVGCLRWFNEFVTDPGHDPRALAPNVGTPNSVWP